AAGFHAGRQIDKVLRAAIEREERLPELAQIARDVAQLQSPRHNGIVSSLPKPFVRQITTEGQASVPWFEMFITALVQIRRPEWKQYLMVLTPAEIASLWHLPDERYRAEKIVWAEGNAPSALTGDQRHATICLGDATVNGQRVPVSLPLSDRSAHSYLVGKTSTGKSTLLHNLIHQDIAGGRGVVVLDPHGKLIDGILARSIPSERQGEVVLLACGDSSQPVPINPFRIPPGVSFHTAFNTVYWVMRKVYADIWVEGQMDVTMRHLIQALLTDPQATPLDIERLFFDTAYRQSVVARMEESDEVSIATLQYWRGFGKRSAGERKELYRPIQNRTSSFLGNRALEYMTCHPHSLDWRGCIDGGKIVLVSLAGEAIRSEVGSLGAIFLGGLFLAAEGLPYLPDGALPRAYVFVDEVERFVTTPLPDMFSQARKFGLSLTLANQFMGQLSAETREGILGNAGTLCSFEVGPEDAGKLRSVLGKEIDEGTLLSLGRYRALVKTRAHGDSQPAFLLTTRDLPQANHPAWTRAEGLSDFLPKQAVKAWLEARYRGASDEEEASKPARKTLPKKGRKQAASGSDDLTDFE
ncbi:MAG: type IV secretion system DNA-binding domain-containing protein, partial [Anaerolineae bacterium]|nr:type IV secretion system DNA-binding domain-containing protein [Anaerolineae bacterium]